MTIWKKYEKEIKELYKKLRTDDDFRENHLIERYGKQWLDTTEDMLDHLHSTYNVPREIVDQVFERILQYSAFETIIEDYKDLQEHRVEFNDAHWVIPFAFALYTILENYVVKSQRTEYTV